MLGLLLIGGKPSITLTTSGGKVQLMLEEVVLRQAEMDDMLKIARKAREAGEIYAAEKHVPLMGAATKDVYLVDDPADPIVAFIIGANCLRLMQ